MTWTGGPSAAGSKGAFSARTAGRFGPALLARRHRPAAPPPAHASTWIQSRRCSALIDSAFPSHGETSASGICGADLSREPARGAPNLDERESGQPRAFPPALARAMRAPAIPSGVLSVVPGRKQGAVARLPGDSRRKSSGITRRQALIAFGFLVLICSTKVSKNASNV